MTQVDTPDYQRGVVSAQKLLATVADTDTSVTVGVPANAETIVVLAPGSLNPGDFTCKGATSGLDYPATPYGPSVTGADTTSIVFDVSAAVDVQVTITYGFAAAFVWYVYSDSAAHVVTSPYLARTQNQIGSTAPVDGLQVAGTDGADLRALKVNTSGELFHAGPNSAARATGALPTIAAPGAGLALKLFTWDANYISSDTRTRFFWTAGGSNIGEVLDPGNVNGSDSGDFAGYTLPADTALGENASGGPAAGFDCILRYATVPA